MTCEHEIIITAITMAAPKPIRVRYRDGSTREFTIDEAAQSIGLAGTIADIVVTTCNTSAILDVGSDRIEP